MSHILVLAVAAALFWPTLIVQPSRNQPAAVQDSELALLAVLENREKFLPYGFAEQRARRTFGELQVQLKVIGEVDSAEGPRKLAVVTVRARSADGRFPQEMIGNWVAYFTPELKFLELHNHGCGNDLRLAGNVIWLGDRSFDLSTREGLDGFKQTQFWC